MRTLSVTIEDAELEAAENAASEANTDVPTLVRSYLDCVANRTALLPPTAEMSSRKRLLDLLKECNISLDGRPTRESFYSDRRFH